jgi:rubredoxin
MQTQSVVINFRGGIVSPGYLKEILEVAQEARVSHVRFGLRQQLRLEVPSQFYKTFIASCVEKNITVYKAKEALPNIVSSYPAAGIFTTDSWLREGVYKDIFDLFGYTPELKINVCDSRQCFVPFFTGHINWVSSSSEHFWHLYIRFPKTGKLYHWKDLVYTNDLPLLSQRIEQEILADKFLFWGNEEADGALLFQRVKQLTAYVNKPATDEVNSDFSLPYYEGFNKENNQLWLGIYRRDEKFPLAFILDVCEICLQSRIGQLYTTTWKTIIVKNIDPATRKLWDYVLGKYRINVRHAANELAWQVEDHAEKGLLLKGLIIRHFDKEDVRTYGLCFAIETVPAASMYGSVIIRKQQNKNPHRLKALERYDIFYKKDFNPNGSELILFREGVEKDFVGTYLAGICKYFYGEQSSIPLLQNGITTQQTKAPEVINIIHQCRHCLTVYVPSIGDEEQGITPETAFDNLPGSYACPLCEAPKEAFVEVEERRA